jgi:hypothetical protein
MNKYLLTLKNPDEPQRILKKAEIEKLKKLKNELLYLHTGIVG